MNEIFFLSFQKAEYMHSFPTTVEYMHSLYASDVQGTSISIFPRIILHYTTTVDFSGSA
jgi:hypothetical protein